MKKPDYFSTRSQYSLSRSTIPFEQPKVLSLEDYLFRITLQTKDLTQIFGIYKNYSKKGFLDSWIGVRLFFLRFYKSKYLIFKKKIFILQFCISPPASVAIIYHTYIADYPKSK